MSDAGEPRLDLDAYLARTGYDGELRPSPAVLEALHLAHATHIPFENLDVLLGRPIRLDLEGLQAKLVRGRRGGYCFEQNELFAAVLERLGFPVTRLAARVRLGSTRLAPRTHMLLKVDVEGGPWLADVGFGGDGLLKPFPLAAGLVVRQYAWSYRLLEDAGLWVLQSLHGGDWRDLYAFTLEPQFLVDFEVANYYVSTHPSSWFLRTLTVQLPTPEARYVLHNREFSVDRGGEVTARPIASDEELLRVLAETFCLELPPGTPLGEIHAAATR
jgi:N-hydroxyarylamine O-acetyltransferase